MRAIKRVLLVGAGGLGSPVALLLARRGGICVTLIDDDVVDRSNLHRQTLYGDGDVGHAKIERAERRLRTEATVAGVTLEVRTHDGRFVPDNALALVMDADIVVEGADNLATKFLVADAAHLSGRPAVHAGVVRWSGWTLASVPGLSACLRCLFEGLAERRAQTCADAGVIGPLVGVVGALQASLVLRLLDGDVEAAGSVLHVDALRGTLRRSRVGLRLSCPLCGTRAIRDLDRARYDGRDAATDARPTPPRRTPRASANVPPDQERETMSVKVRIPTPMRTLTGQRDEVDAAGATVRAVLDDLERQCPGIKDRVLDDKGVRRFVNIYLNDDDDIRFLDGLETPVKPGDALQIVPAIAGG